VKWAIVGVLAITGAGAQSLRVYSEFVSFDAAGEPAVPKEPREILSPAIVRNGFTSFQIVVEQPADRHWTLYVGENPEGAVRVTVYRESGDKFEPVKLPFEGAGVAVFWMDLWAARNAVVQRIKIEPQLAVKADWLTYPMEVRVMDAAVPDSASGVKPLCSGAPSGASDRDRLRMRNLMQDAALARMATARPPAAAGCGAEDYLKVRDGLFRLQR
jgi:hypothetical protein